MFLIFQYFIVNISSPIPLLFLKRSVLFGCGADGVCFGAGYSAGGVFLCVANSQKLWDWSTAHLARSMLGAAGLAVCLLGWGLNTEGTPRAKLCWFLLCRRLGSAFKKWGFVKANRGGRGGGLANTDCRSCPEASL